MPNNCCDRCGDYLPDGSVRYTVHIQILSDFDGIILFQDEDAPGEDKKSGDNIQAVSEPELTEDIFQEFSLMLCSNCKNEFASDPFNRELGFVHKNNNFQPIFH